MSEFTSNQIRFTVEVINDFQWQAQALRAMLDFDLEAQMAAQEEEMRLTQLLGPRLGPGRNELAAVRRREWRVSQLRTDLARWGRAAGPYVRCPPHRRALRRSRW